VIDENYINNQFLGVFYSKKVFSLTEQIMKWIPDNLKQYSKILEGFLTTSTIGNFMPQILEEFSPSKRMDLRCGFSKQFLNDHLEDIYVS
jgi:hypothetical protein